MGGVVLHERSSPRAPIRHTRKAQNLGKKAAVGNPADMPKTVPKGGYVLDRGRAPLAGPSQAGSWSYKTPTRWRAGVARGGTPALTLEQLPEQLTHDHVVVELPGAIRSASSRVATAAASLRRCP
jgi:hypothetical protein